MLEGVAGQRRTRGGEKRDGPAGFPVGGRGPGHPLHQLHLPCWLLLGKLKNSIFEQREKIEHTCHTVQCSIHLHKYLLLHALCQALCWACDRGASSVQWTLSAHTRKRTHGAQDTCVHTTCVQAHTLEPHPLCQITSCVSLSSHPVCTPHVDLM